MNVEFDRLNALKAAWDALQPLTPESEARLWKKFRLLWNYHSNHIEGNTLTYGETELLLLHDQAIGNHGHRDYLEMKAHDLGIEHVRGLAADLDRLITESDIRDLNKIILKEPFWKAAQTANGQPTLKEIIPGQYKTAPNNVRTTTGELFAFASPEDTGPSMDALVRRLRTELSAGNPHPIVLATKLHHDFVLIHPFDDGNGRVARLLVNYVLLRSGYPPVIVRSEDKLVYLRALRLADAGELDAFITYQVDALCWSLDLAIRAAKGESIEETSDVEKEVALFVRDQQARKIGITVQTKETIQQLFEIFLIPFLKKAEVKLFQLAPLFQRLEVRTHDGRHGIVNYPGISFTELQHVGPGDSPLISFMFYSYQGEAVAPFDFETVIQLHFPVDHYTVLHNQHMIVSNPYSKPILAEEADNLTAQILASTFASIKVKADEKMPNTGK
jgi:Fic family protein